MKGKPKFNQLLPILFVRDLVSEIAFYKVSGFEVSYQGTEFPGFVGLKKENVEFGLEERKNFDPQKAVDNFIWQMDTDSFGKVIKICKERGIEYSEPKKTPNGYTLYLEKTGKD